MSRKAYVLTLDSTSRRARHAKEIFDIVGMEVVYCDVIKDENRRVGHRKSMLEILKKVENSEEEWAYIFEDDVQFYEYIGPPRLKKFEALSENFYYLGCYSQSEPEKTDEVIDDEVPVYRIKKDFARLSHAFGISKKGAKILLDSCSEFPEVSFGFDELLWRVFYNESPIVVMGDYQSEQRDNEYGIAFQDRWEFSESPNPQNDLEKPLFNLRLYE